MQVMIPKDIDTELVAGIYDAEEFTDDTYAVKLPDSNVEYVLRNGEAVALPEIGKTPALVTA